MSKRSARGLSSSRSHDSDTVEDCKAAFLIVFGDINQEIVSRKELETVLQQAGRNPTERVLKKYWNSSVKSLTFENFVDICRKEHSTTTDDLMKAFRKIDTNRDGFISKDELYDMMTTKGENMSMAEVKAIIDEVDINKDGKLDYLEFCNMVVNTANDCKKMSRKVMEKIEKKKNKTAAFRSEASPREQKRSHVTPPKPVDRHKKGSARSPVSGRIIKLPEPRNIKDWTHLAYKGCFFLEEDNRILSHQYSLQLPTDSHVWITIQPYNVASDLGDEGHPVDTALYVLRDKSDSAANNLVTFTEQRNHTGKYGVRCDLDAGTYLLCPMTSGCRLKPRRTEPKTEAKLIKTEKNGTVTLSKAFKKALEDIFDISDLDGNGLLSREEFSLFSLRTTGEQVADDEWGVVEDNVSMENGEVTKAGFLRLNEMEAEDNDGDTEDSWITLSNMGFNKSLAMDEACPFRVDVYVESCPRARLSVLGMETASMKLENAVCTSIIQKGEISKVKGVKDLNMYTYIGDARASAVLENKSHSRLEVQLNCSRSTNVLSSKGSLDHVVELPGRSMMVAQHLIPDDETAEWSVLFGDASVR